MITKEINFKNNRGSQLAGKLDSPKYGNIKSYSIFVHCFTCTMELKAITYINSVLTKYGIAVLRFDLTGIGSSEGSFPETNFTTQIEDVLAAAKFLEDNYAAPELLIGHSLGGAAILFAVPQITSVKAIVTIASPEEPGNLAVKLKRTKQRCLKNGVAEAEIGGVKFNFKPQFFADIESYDLGELQKKINIPYLVMHSTADIYADFKNAEILFARANQPKSFVSLHNIDHLMLNTEDAEYVGNLIGVWGGKYLSK